MMEGIWYTGHAHRLDATPQSWDDLDIDLPSLTADVKRAARKVFSPMDIDKPRAVSSLMDSIWAES